MGNMSYYMSWVMVVVVTAIAIWALFSPSAELVMPGSRRYWMGGISIAYATFRVVRLYRQYQSRS